MKSLRKAQGATEYLIVLAVVIIIALIVVAAMGGIPGIGGQAKTRASESYWATADVALTSYSVDTTKTTLIIRNNLRDSITIGNISLGGTTLTTTPALGTLKAGQSKTYTSTTVKCTTAGDAFSYAVVINYVDSATSTSYSFTGDGTPIEGICGT